MACAKETCVPKYNDITECSICVDSFKNPKCLPCIHTFCLECLQKYGSYNDPGDELACPLCRKMFCIPTGGFSHLPNNFLMARLLEQNKGTPCLATGCQIGEIICDICE